MNFFFFYNSEKCYKFLKRSMNLNILKFLVYALNYHAWYFRILFHMLLFRELKARQENDFIYHELVPAPKNIPKIEVLLFAHNTFLAFIIFKGIKLSKPVGFNPCDPSIIGADLFNSLLPTDVIKTISLYSEEKSKLKRGILAKVDQRDQELE